MTLLGFVLVAPPAMTALLYAMSEVLLVATHRAIDPRVLWYAAAIELPRLLAVRGSRSEEPLVIQLYSREACMRIGIPKEIKKSRISRGSHARGRARARGAAATKSSVETKAADAIGLSDDM